MKKKQNLINLIKTVFCCCEQNQSDSKPPRMCLRLGHIALVLHGVTEFICQCVPVLED